MYDYDTLRKNLFVMAGPCVVESRDLCMRIAEHARMICEDLDISYVFKASYKKANRSSIQSFKGIGDEEALRVLSDVKEAFDVPIVTDVHTEAEATWAAEVADVLQIPAFLCRQTSLLLAAGKTGKYVNIKKGQFLAPEGMQHAAKKVASTGNSNIMLTERGTTFGYEDLVVDMKAFPIMKETGYLSVMDATHALQKPNGGKGVTGGQPKYIPTMVNASIAAGADGLFIETHPDPSNALSDGANMLPMDQLRNVLSSAKAIYDIVR